MRALLLLLSTSLAAPALAQDITSETQTVVITGTPLKDTAARLAECIARKCPPKEDIDASLAHAENQLVAGDYAGGRRTLDKARGRNRQYAAMFPTQVSDLLRARGRLTNLDGRVGPGRLSQIESLEALKAGLDHGDSRVLMQRLLVGDEFANAGRVKAAESVYRKVERQARKAGRLQVAGYAMLRDALVHGIIASVDPAYQHTARQKLARIENSPEPELAEFREAAKLVRVRLASLDKDPAALDQAIAAIPPRSPDKPLLVYAPAILEDQATLPFGDAPLTSTDNGAPEWIDIQFRITAEARCGTCRYCATPATSRAPGPGWWRLR
ncbi:hypothetical protein [Sphingomonas xinjiangensis]|uniref:Uncharacterized protein n=1 Tax=Sphingomonas xinjiangensis TaxID=643568 RepID=A0A840YH52_9SPHN|nr:hypothetical protein [Sphingomonas xinjiangensis]MBB5710138.1 hypothetical protein [Sphingomonas xinjiangensis]